MIKNDFYDNSTQTQIAEMDFTKYVPAIPIEQTAAPGMYWLGWIAIDNLPQFFHVSRIMLNNNGYEFQDTTPQENFDCGYSFRVPPTSTYVSDNRLQMSRYQSGVSKWQANGGAQNQYNFCFGNKVDVMADGISQVQLFGAYVIYGGDDSIVNRNLSTSAANLKTFSFSEWISFINGGSFSITLNTYGTFTVNFSDLETGTAYIENENYKMRLFLVGYNFIPTRRTYKSGSLWYDGVGTTACFMVHIKNEIYGDTIVTGGSTTQDTIGYWNNTQPTAALSIIGMRGVKGYFSFDTLNMLNWSSNPFVYNDTALVFRDGNSTINWIHALFPIAEVVKHFNLCHRMTDIETGYKPYYGYYENTVFAPYITDENEFTATRITGNLTDDSFKEKLRLWQWDIEEWAENNYTEDDRPPYEPPSPGDESENIGDKITLPSSLGIGGTNGFVTHYALTAADVAQLGALLWTSFVDTDYWKNFLFSLSLETGTLNLSGLLNFFLSLKVYPFSMVNVAGYHQSGQDMYIGTGTVPLHFTTTIGVIGNMCDYIQGGYCDVPAHFKDYRDYINTKITLYVPFCGTVDLNPGDVIGNRVRVIYAVDFATGGCIAYIMMETGDGAAGFPVGALTGQIGADVPLTATAAGEVAARFVSDAMHVGGLVGGEVGNLAGGIAGAMSGQPTGGGSGSGSPLSGIAGMYGGLPAAMGVDLAPGIAAHGLTMATRAAVSAPMLSGGRGFASFGAPQFPYIQIRRGIYPEISSYSEIYGNAGAGSYKISELSGYVSGDVKTDGLSCPENEKAAIRKLIANGIYV